MSAASNTFVQWYLLNRATTTERCIHTLVFSYQGTPSAGARLVTNQLINQLLALKAFLTHGAQQDRTSKVFPGGKRVGK